jgi:hypothetical protein
MTFSLTPETAAFVSAHAERTGLTHEAALDDLVRRGLAQLDWRAMRDDLADVRASIVDLLAGQDALAPYTVALLTLLAHWSAKTGAAKVSEEEYQTVALDTARLIWDALLASRGVPPPPRPVAETRAHGA